MWLAYHYKLLSGVGKLSLLNMIYNAFSSNLISYLQKVVFLGNFPHLNNKNILPQSPMDNCCPNLVKDCKNKRND